MAYSKDALKTKKDRNVQSSSHGKFGNVAELVAHQNKMGKHPPRIVERINTRDNWLSRDGQRDTFIDKYLNGGK